MSTATVTTIVPSGLSTIAGMDFYGDDLYVTFQYALWKIVGSEVILVAGKKNAYGNNLADLPSSRFGTMGGVVVTDDAIWFSDYSYKRINKITLLPATQDHTTCEACPDNTYKAFSGEEPGGTASKCLCSEDYHVSDVFSGFQYQKYAGTTCSTHENCQSLCRQDATCEGYTYGKKPELYEWGGTTGILFDGSLQTIGNNYNGNAGQDESSDNDITSLGIAMSGVKEFHTARHVLAVKHDNTVWTWGGNSNGQAGLGDTTGRRKPTQIPDIDASLVKQFSPGYQNNHLVMKDGSLLCAGQHCLTPDVNQQVFAVIPLFDGSTPEKTVVKSSIGAGGYHRCILLGNKRIKCMGHKNYGQLGDGSHEWNGNRQTWGYTSVIDGLTPATSAIDVFSSNYQSCAQMEDLTYKCWGKHGYANSDYNSVPTTSTLLGYFDGSTDAKTVKKLLLNAEYNICVLAKDGRVRCSGAANGGWLGRQCYSDSSWSVHNFNTPVKDLTNVVDIRTGGYTMQAMLEDGKIYIWGRQPNSNFPGTTDSYKYCPFEITGYGTIVPSEYGAIVAGVGDSYTKEKGCNACPTNTASSAGGDPMLGQDTQCGCKVDTFVSSNQCQTCPAGSTNAAGDDVAASDTFCDCGENLRVSSGACVACNTGATNAAGDNLGAGDSYCTCGVNQFVLNGECNDCTVGSTRASGDDAGTGNTYCTCGVNQYVSNGVCVDCASGSTRAAGDDAGAGNTVCLIAPCAKDYRVKDNVCVLCPSGMTNDAGDDNANGDTYCDSTFVCGADQYVSNHVCQNCPTAKTAPYGANPAGANTVCDWESVWTRRVFEWSFLSTMQRWILQQPG